MFMYKAQRGQALVEYNVLIPVAIMITVAASLLVGFIVNSMNKTVDAFKVEPYGIPCESADVGPEIAKPGNHAIELTSSVYNEGDDTTTLTYKVTSGPQPSISHWTLGLPQFVANNIVETSEKVESWGTDPTTGVDGSKFDTGYEVDGGKGNNGGNDADDGGKGNNGGNDADDGGKGNNGGNDADDGGKGNNGGKRGKLLSPVYSPKMQYTDEEIETVARTVVLLVTGQYDFGPLEASVKAGTDTYVFTISGPVSYHDPALDSTDCDNQG